MSYNKMVYRINHKGEKIYCDIDKLQKTNYIIELVCDECGESWSTGSSNWLKRRKKDSYAGDFCRSCFTSGKGNPAYGKSPHRNMSEEELNTLKDNLSLSMSGENNPMYGKQHTSTTRALQSKSKVDLIAEGKFDIKSCNRGRKAYYISKKSNTQFYADSILELARMIELDNDDNVKSWTKYHKIRIPYIYESTQYQYVPDFLIEYLTDEIYIEEVKGRIIPRDIEKQAACKLYCIDNNYKYRMFLGKDLLNIKMYKQLLRDTKCH